MKRFGAFVVFMILVRMLADAQTNVGSSGMHAQWFLTGRSEQMIMMSFHDVTRVSCAIERGNYKRRALPNLGAVIWVFWY